MRQEKIVTYLEGDNGVTEKIKKAMYDIARNYVYIGFLLWEVQEYGYYREHSYDSVYEYAEAELGFKRTTTKNMIAINYTFGCENGRATGGIAHQRTMSLQPAYKDFNYSQLCEMLAMSPAQRQQVTPDMTVKQLREMKRGQTSDQEEISVEAESGQTSDHKDDLMPVTINNTWHDIPKTLARQLAKAAGISTRVKSYKITIEPKKANEG